jgi:hypothetical protein
MLSDEPPSLLALYSAKLLDALAQIPALYHELDVLISKKLAARNHVVEGEQCLPTAVQELLNRSLRLRDDVHSQRRQWRAGHAECEFSSNLHAAIASTQPYPCTTVIHFSSLPVANAFTLYNAIMMLISQFVISSNSLLSPYDINIVEEEAAITEIPYVVTEILKSIDYHLLFAHTAATSVSGASGIGNFYLLFPIRVAYRALLQSDCPQDISKRLWLEDVLRIIKNRAGPWMSNGRIFNPREQKI